MDPTNVGAATAIMNRKRVEEGKLQVTRLSRQSLTLAAGLHKPA